jgi:hypothetical protein
VNCFAPGSFEFPVAILTQHPYTLKGKRLLLAVPVWIAEGLLAAVQEVAGQGNEEPPEARIRSGKSSASL